MKLQYFKGYTPLEFLGYNFCDFLYKIADKMERFAYNMDIDWDVVGTIPLQYVEKKCKTIKPRHDLFDFLPIKHHNFLENQIKLHAVLEGFDKERIRTAQKRIVEAAKFIIGNAETKMEKELAIQLSRMFRKGAIVITDTYLTGNERSRAFFPSKYSNGNTPYIGFDITSLLKNNNACLVNDLIHEAYHAYRYYTSDTEYSIIDEARAWNAALQFSNKYRAMHGIPIKRENEYTIEELSKKGEEYKNAFNVNVRFNFGEHWLEKFFTGLTNILADVNDTIEGWTDKIMDKTCSG